MSEENIERENLFFLVRNGRFHQVSKERWEQSWLDWWRRSANRTQR